MNKKNIKLIILVICIIIPLLAIFGLRNYKNNKIGVNNQKGQKKSEVINDILDQKQDSKFSKDYLSKVIKSYYNSIINEDYSAAYNYEFKPEFHINEGNMQEVMSKDDYLLLQKKSPIKLLSFSVLAISLDNNADIGLDKKVKAANVALETKILTKEDKIIKESGPENIDMWVFVDSNWYHVFQ